ncbi:hypothetical protein F4825DRAFT_453315 [Nemania diffusa]|nr:hypothetical protein F4825DRAFT_453315 [Nemania diffusa]
MPADKDRLYIALYARGRESNGPNLQDKYHWALIVAPKVNPDDNTRSIRFHAKETISAETPQLRWTYEEEPLDRGAMNILLTRVAIGKVLDIERLRSTFASIPIRPEVPSWNCVGWVQEAVETVLKDRKALSTSVNNWGEAKATAIWYIRKKTAEHRFDGQGDFSGVKVATWDMLRSEEVVP